MGQILFLGLERDNLLINLEAKRRSTVCTLPDHTYCNWRENRQPISEWLAPLFSSSGIIYIYYVNYRL